jgi:hypothetical protein
MRDIGAIAWATCSWHRQRPIIREGMLKVIPIEYGDQARAYYGHEAVARLDE